jgi:hypothetical protein
MSVANVVFQASRVLQGLRMLFLGQLWQPAYENLLPSSACKDSHALQQCPVQARGLIIELRPSQQLA